MLTPRPDSGGVPTPGQTSPNRSHAALARDAALARVGTTRRLAILGSAGLSAALAGFISTSPPSKASTTSATRTPAPATTAPQKVASAPSRGQAPSLPPLANASSLGLQGPDQ